PLLPGAHEKYTSGYLSQKREVPQASTAFTFFRTFIWGPRSGDPWIFLKGSWEKRVAESLDACWDTSSAGMREKPEKMTTLPQACMEAEEHAALHMMLHALWEM
ncbi:hypothetical protein ANANG_G00149410, partial [Anguilla anguilla]